MADFVQRLTVSEQQCTPRPWTTHTRTCARIQHNSTSARTEHRAPDPLVHHTYTMSKLHRPDAICCQCSIIRIDISACSVPCCGERSDRARQLGETQGRETQHVSGYGSRPAENSREATKLTCAWQVCGDMGLRAARKFSRIDGGQPEGRALVYVGRSNGLLVEPWCALGRINGLLVSVSRFRSERAIAITVVYLHVQLN